MTAFVTRGKIFKADGVIVNNESFTHLKFNSSLPWKVTDTQKERRTSSSPQPSFLRDYVKLCECNFFESALWVFLWESSQFSQSGDHS